jgi:pimeloyl-ACP methyl ester carboxylesterase
MSIVKVREINTHVLELNHDAEESIIMVHGMFGNLAQFYLTLAPHLSNKYRVVMYDIKSHGRSDKSEKGYDLVSLTDDMLELMNALEIDSAHFVGFSYGALMTLKFAMRFPDRVRKIALIETPPRPDEPLKSKGGYNFDDFLTFAFTLPEHVKTNFLRNKKQVDKTYKMYEYIYNWTSFVDDMNTERDLERDELFGIKHNILLLYGTRSVCLPMAYKLCTELNNPKVLIKEGDHGFFMNHCAEVSSDLDKFFSLEKENSTANTVDSNKIFI